MSARSVLSWYNKFLTRTHPPCLDAARPLYGVRYLPLSRAEPRAHASPRTVPYSAMLASLRSLYPVALAYYRIVAALMQHYRDRTRRVRHGALEFRCSWSRCTENAGVDTYPVAASLRPLPMSASHVCACWRQLWRPSLLYRCAAMMPFLAALLASEHYAFAVPLPKEVTAYQLAQLAKDVQATPEGTTTLTRITDGDQYVVLFIPGILGSQLKDPRTREVIWGGSDRPKADTLRLWPDSPYAISNLLDSFNFLHVKDVDIYGDAWRKLQKILGPNAIPLEFPYDWRQDIDRITDTFDRDYVHGLWAAQLRDRRLIIIAHSMGGVVAWNWKNRYYDADSVYDAQHPSGPSSQYPFDLVRLILLGVPLKGSCDALRMLLNGYSDPTTETNAWLREAYRLVFADLQSAALTFPSVFELLPLEGDQVKPDQLCFTVKPPETPMRILSPEPWEHNLDAYFTGHRSDASILHGLLSSLVSEKSLAGQLGMSDGDFTEHIDRLVNLATGFRQRFQLSEGRLAGRVAYFYSKTSDTTTRVSFDTKGWSVDRAVAPGDGRVLPDSAMNTGVSSVDVTRLAHQTHGDLPKDDALSDFLDQEVAPRADRVKGREIQSVIANNPELLRNIARSGMVVPPVSVEAPPGVNVERYGTDDEVSRVNLVSAGFLHPTDTGNMIVKGLERARQAAQSFEQQHRQEQACILWEAIVYNTQSNGQSWEMEALLESLECLADRKDEAGSSVACRLAERAKILLNADERRLWPSYIVREVNRYYGKPECSAAAGRVGVPVADANGVSADRAGGP